MSRRNEQHAQRRYKKKMGLHSRMGATCGVKSSSESGMSATIKPVNLPTFYQRWHLYGSGLDRVRLETVPLTLPAPDEILVRHDACGICFSDIKIINLGGEHPRLTGRNLAENPVVMGHEVTLTVVAVGENRADRFAVGKRYIVQADVYYQGTNLAYGYAITGGMSQYGLIGKGLPVASFERDRAQPSRPILK